MPKLVYEKPQIQYWTAAELDAVEASMSSTGSGTTADIGSVGTAPAPYQWFRRGLKVSSTRRVWEQIAEVADIIVDVATSGLSKKTQFASKIATTIATDYVANNIENIYFKSRLYEIKIDDAWNTPMSPLYNPLGYAAHTLFYRDSAYKELIGDIFSNDLDDNLQYLVNYLPISKTKA